MNTTSCPECGSVTDKFWSTGTHWTRRCLNGHLWSGIRPGLYNMIRETDQTGVSGTGRVAQVAIFEDGSAVVRWLTETRSTVVWEKAEDMIKVHIEAHPDSTRLEDTL